MNNAMMILQGLMDFLPILIASVVAIWFSARKQRSWSALTKQEKNTKIAIITVGIILFVAGAIAAFLY